MIRFLIFARERGTNQKTFELSIKAFQRSDFFKDEEALAKRGKTACPGSHGLPGGQTESWPTLTSRETAP